MWISMQHQPIARRPRTLVARVCGLAALLSLWLAPLAHATDDVGGTPQGSAAAPVILLPDAGQPVMLSLPEGGSITARSRQARTAVQLVTIEPGTTVMMVVAGSAVMQHSVAGRSITGFARSDGLATLTPSCTAAEVLVTVTGNTRTTFTDGCPVDLSGAGQREPVLDSVGNLPAKDVRVFAPGALNQRTLMVDVDVNALHQAESTQRAAALNDGFNVYVLAFVPGPLAGSPVPVILQKLTTGGWGPLTSPLAALMGNVAPQTADARVLIEVVQNTDLSALVGTEIFLGYGITDEEMLQAGRFRAIYRVR